MASISPAWHFVHQHRMHRRSLLHCVFLPQQVKRGRKSRLLVLVYCLRSIFKSSTKLKSRAFFCCSMASASASMLVCCVLSFCFPSLSSQPQNCPVTQKAPDGQFPRRKLVNGYKRLQNGGKRVVTAGSCQYPFFRRARFAIRPFLPGFLLFYARRSLRRGRINPCLAPGYPVRFLHTVNAFCKPCFFRTQRGKGQAGRPLSFIAHTHLAHSSGGCISLHPAIFRAKARRRALKVLRFFIIPPPPVQQS